MKDPDPTTSVSDADDLRDRLWAYEDFSTVQEHPSIDVTGAFASLGFLRAALRRARRFWLLMGALGFLVGCGLYVASPPPYSASITLLLTNAPGTDPATAMLTEQSLAASLPVATAVVKQLGLTESPGSPARALHGDARQRPGTEALGQRSVEHPSGAVGRLDRGAVPQVPRQLADHAGAAAGSDAQHADRAGADEPRRARCADHQSRRENSLAIVHSAARDDSHR